MNYTHADLLAGAQEGRERAKGDPYGSIKAEQARDDHADDLAATLDRHKPISPPAYPAWYPAWCAGCDHLWDECPDAIQVADRLTVWGVLDGDGA